MAVKFSYNCFVKVREIYFVNKHEYNGSFEFGHFLEALLA